MADWFLKQGAVASGPYTWEDLRFLSRRGKLAPHELVRQGQVGDWLAAIDIEGLCAPSQALPAPDSMTPTAPPREVRSAMVSPPQATSRVQTITETGALKPQPRPVPPQLPKRALSRDDRRRLTALAAVGGVVCALLLLFLLLVQFNWPAGPEGGRAGGTGIADGSATRVGTANGSDVGPDMGAGVPGSATDAADRDEVAVGNETPLSAALSASAGEHADQSAAEPAKSDGDASTSASPAPPTPPPRAAAVIRPLDDDADDSDAADGAGGAAAGGSSEFFQVRAKGKRFAYVVDCSGSMSGQPFRKACAELLASIQALKSSQRFYVAFFSDVAYPQFYPHLKRQLLPANSKNKKQITDWLAGFQESGGTDPSDALIKALALRPDAIYLLSDGEFDPGIADLMRLRNKHHTPIHTIAFMDRAAEPLLRRIAKENDGTFRFVP